MGHRGNRDENHWKNKNRMRRTSRRLQSKSDAMKENSDSTFNESALVTSKMRDDEIDGGTATKPLQLVSEKSGNDTLVDDSTVPGDGKTESDENATEIPHEPLHVESKTCLKDQDNEKTSSILESEKDQPNSDITNSGVTVSTSVLMKGESVKDNLVARGAETVLTSANNEGDKFSTKVVLGNLDAHADEYFWENEDGTRSKRSQPDSPYETTTNHVVVLVEFINAVFAEIAASHGEVTLNAIARELLQLRDDTDFELLEESKALEVVDQVTGFASDVAKECAGNGKSCKGVDVIKNGIGTFKKIGKLLGAQYEDFLQDGGSLDLLVNVKNAPSQIEKWKKAIDDVLISLNEVKDKKIPDAERSRFYRTFGTRLDDMEGALKEFGKKNFSVPELNLLTNEMFSSAINAMSVLNNFSFELAKNDKVITDAQNEFRNTIKKTRELSKKYPIPEVKKFQDKLETLSLNSHFPQLPVNGKNYTHGFPNGVVDLVKLFTDIDADFVKHTILNGTTHEEKKKMFDNLSLLSKEIQPMNAELQKGKSIVFAERTVNGLLNTIRDDFDRVEKLETTTQCFNSVKKFNGTLSTNEWNAEKKLIESLGNGAQEFALKINQVLFYTPNFDKFIKTFDNDNDGIATILKNMEEHKDLPVVIKELTDLSGSLGGLLNFAGIADWVKNSKVDTLFSEAKTWFNSSGAANVINCLRNKEMFDTFEKEAGSLDMSPAFQKLTPNNIYVAQLLETQKNAKSLIKESKKMAKALNKKIVNQSYQKHSFNVTNPFEVVRDLGFASKFLRDLKKAKNSHEAIYKLMGAEDAIDNHINSISDPVLKLILTKTWTPEKKNTLKKLSGIIKQLEAKITQVPKTLEGYGEVFKNSDNLDGLSDVDLAEFVDLLQQTGYSSLDKETSAKLQGLNLEFANGKLKMKSGLEAFIKTLPFLTAFSAPAILNIGQELTTNRSEPAPESSDWKYAIGICAALLLVLFATFLVTFSIFCFKLRGQPDRGCTSLRKTRDVFMCCFKKKEGMKKGGTKKTDYDKIDPGRITKNEVVYKCPKGVIIVEPESNVSIDYSQVGVRGNENKSTEPSLEDTQLESDKAVKDALAKNKKLHERINEAKKIGKDQNLKQISQTIIQDVEVSKNKKNKLKFEPRARVDYNCGIGIDIYEV
ncbi:hypothetical protein CRE_09544 [Caenorhabditis remanei]|uniref:Domain of unknown function WSN domain-containing protein n=1 Tax=Caenorhabditis remanei TaxID=31234 RepID=E3MJ31_CAERE|nr:hypothetical protein CRE_09544 [Caenorhabditis remanei]